MKLHCSTWMVVIYKHNETSNVMTFQSQLGQKALKDTTVVQEKYRIETYFGYSLRSRVSWTFEFGLIFKLFPPSFHARKPQL